MLSQNRYRFSISFILHVIVLMILSSGVFSQVGIGTETPDPASILELSSVERGLLPPRMNTVQRDAITDPPFGLQIYNTDSHCMEYYRPTGWYAMCPKLPALTTLSATSVTGVSATSGGAITDDGGATVVARGVCWSVNPTPTLSDDFTIDGLGIGQFSSSISGLSNGTTYFVRAYATNSVGTAYGNETTFSTLDIPSVSTQAATQVFGRNATGWGNVTGDGGAMVTDRGLCWSVSPDPTTDDNSLSLGSGTGTFSGVIGGLDYSTLYYIRAYAINDVGTAYGNQVTLTTTTGTLVSYTSTGSHTWSVPEGVKTVDVVVVAGGGGGGRGCSGGEGMGGGGGGGVISQSLTIESPSVNLQVGPGGSGGIFSSATNATNGTNSFFGDLVAIGGGAGAVCTYFASGSSGGSGGGGGANDYSSSSGSGGAGTAGQGNRGGNGGNTGNGEGYKGGGGGGAGVRGQDITEATVYNGLNGGDGIASSITGSLSYYGGGGGGGSIWGSYVFAMSGGTGGLGGGANGGGSGNSNGPQFPGDTGTPNTGGGGGGGGYTKDGGNGGSGVVYIRY